MTEVDPIETDDSVVATVWVSRGGWLLNRSGLDVTDPESWWALYWKKFGDLPSDRECRQVFDRPPTWAERAYIREQLIGKFGQPNARIKMTEKSNDTE